MLPLQDHEHFIQYPPSPEEYAEQLAKGIADTTMMQSVPTSVEEGVGNGEDEVQLLDQEAVGDEELRDSGSSAVKGADEALNPPPVNVVAPEEPSSKRMRAEDFLDLTSGYMSQTFFLAWLVYFCV